MKEGFVIGLSVIAPDTPPVPPPTGREFVKVILLGRALVERIADIEKKRGERAERRKKRRRTVFPESDEY